MTVLVFGEEVKRLMYARASGCGVYFVGLCGIVGILGISQILLCD